MANPRLPTCMVIPAGTMQCTLRFWDSSVPARPQVVPANPLTSSWENANNLDSPSYTKQITHAMSSPTTSEPKSLLKPVPKEQRRRYGIPTMEILATNNPTDSCLFTNTSGSTFSLRKKIDTIQNSEFAYVFEAKIRGPIEALLYSSLPPPCGWILLPLRMRFPEVQSANPIIVHLLVDQDSLSDDGACKLVEKIAGLISAEWQGEEVFMDLCRKVNIPELRDDNTGGIDLYEHFSEVYFYRPPLPGFSIGPKNHRTCAGSFTGFIKHENAAYGLTCEHVVNPLIKQENEVKKPHATGRDNGKSELAEDQRGRPEGASATTPTSLEKRMLGSVEPYKYKDGEAKFGITIPAIADHKETMKGITNRVNKAKIECQLNPIQAELTLYSKRHKARADEGAAKRAALDAMKEEADQYDCDMGHLYATSGVDRSAKFYEGRLDWGIFYYSFSNAQNMHHKRSFFDSHSGFQLNAKDRKYVNTEIKPEFFEEAEEYINECPQFKPLRTYSPKPDEIFFKLASRTSNVRVAKYNEVMATVKEPGFGKISTREMCFITPSITDRVSLRGDSGALVVDAEFKPYGMVWGGNESGIPDLTFVTPIHVILKDIELQMGWEAGSASY